MLRGGDGDFGLLTLQVTMNTPVSYAPLEPYSQALFDAVVHAVPEWICRRVTEISLNSHYSAAEIVNRALPEIASQTTEYVAQELHRLLAQDVDVQRNNPLQILRNSVSFATDVLRSASISEARRDEFDTASMPNDVYAIGPLTWRDVSDEVHEAGITWGAWKAATILQRRRDEGKIS